MQDGNVLSNAPKHGQKTKTSMRTAFVAVSYKQREMMADVLDCIESQLSSHHYDPMVFVRQYGFASNATDAMMHTSFAHIRDCDLFIVELSHKVVGVGIEAGYASAHGKPIVYIRHDSASQSTTMTGIADFEIVYRDTNTLTQQLADLLKRI